MIEEIPMYSLMKIKAVSLMGMNADAVHIYAGMVFFLLLAITFRRGSPSGWLLLPGFIASIVVEILDYHYAMHSVGYFSRYLSLMDILNTNIIPVVLYLLLRRNYLPKPRDPETGLRLDPRG